MKMLDAVGKTVVHLSEITECKCRICRQLRQLVWHHNAMYSSVDFINLNRAIRTNKTCQDKSPIRQCKTEIKRIVENLEKSISHNYLVDIIRFHREDRQIGNRSSPVCWFAIRLALYIEFARRFRSHIHPRSHSASSSG